MIEYALSKMNLLIFVMAIAAITLFFMNTVNSNLRSIQGNELIINIGSQIKNVIDSPSFCTIKFIEIPQTIKINQGANLNYILYMQNNIFTEENKLGLAILDRKLKKIYAAYDVDYKGEIYFYESEFNLNSQTYDFKETQENIKFDPLKVKSIDKKILILKTINEGINEIYIIPCDKDITQKYSCKNITKEIFEEDKQKFSCLSQINELIE